MTQITEAVFADGVLKPVDRLQLREDERVRLIVQPLEPRANGDRDAAFAEFVAGVERMNFRATRRYPTRDELHERR